MTPLEILMEWRDYEISKLGKFPKETSCNSMIFREGELISGLHKNPEEIIKLGKQQGWLK